MYWLVGVTITNSFTIAIVVLLLQYYCDSFITIAIVYIAVVSWNRELLRISSKS